jgi:hypothetical protein
VCHRCTGFRHRNEPQQPVRRPSKQAAGVQCKREDLSIGTGSVLCDVPHPSSRALNRFTSLQARLLSVDDDIRPVIEYLKSLGLSDQQVKEVGRHQAQCVHMTQERLVVRAPIMLPHSEHPQDRAVVFITLLVDKRQVVLEHPPVVSYSPAEQLQPFLDGLRDLGIRDPLAVVVRRPSLLGLSLRDNVQVSHAFTLLCSISECSKFGPLQDASTPML